MARRVDAALTIAGPLRRGSCEPLLSNGKLCAFITSSSSRSSNVHAATRDSTRHKLATRRVRYREAFQVIGLLNAYRSESAQMNAAESRCINTYTRVPLWAGGACPHEHITGTSRACHDRIALQRRW